MLWGWETEKIVWINFYSIRKRKRISSCSVCKCLIWLNIYRIKRRKGFSERYSYSIWFEIHENQWNYKSFFDSLWDYGKSSRHLFHGAGREKFGRIRTKYRSISEIWHENICDAVEKLPPQLSTGWRMEIPTHILSLIV